jgi:hypothetical protein
MLKPYLIEANRGNGKHDKNPYDPDDAQYLADRCQGWCWDMMDYMWENHKAFAKGQTILGNSPLRTRPWLAAALKTLDYVAEVTEEGQPCTLVLTKKGLELCERGE